jgi:hypothetical protein
MSTNPDIDGLVTPPPTSDGFETERPVAGSVEALPQVRPEIGYSAQAPEPIAQTRFGEPAPMVALAMPEAQPTWVAPAPAMAPERATRNRGWVGLVGVGLLGLIVASTLGYFLYTTTGQRDAALRQVASTQSALTATQGTLSTTQDEVRSRKATAAYMSMYVSDSARTRVDYQKLAACNTFGGCRTAAQSALSDMQTFQSDRSAAAVPAALANSDGMIRDALSAAIAADEELISGMDNSSNSKFKDGWHKLIAAMLSMAKAETVLGSELK